MSRATHSETAPQDRIPFLLKVVYGLGAFVNNLLAAASGGMMIVLNLGFGMNPALVGLLGALPRLTDALTDPLMGFISDHTRSKWGRRRPYIFGGAIAAGLVFALLWQLPRGQSQTFYFVYFLVGSIIFYLAYTVFATPWVALGYELTPDYNERTRLMGVQNFIGQLAYVASPWFLWIMTNEDWFDDQASGAAALAIIIAVVTIGVGILPAIFLRERFKDGDDDAKPKGGFLRNMKQFFRGFGLVLKSKPFLLLCLATFLVFNGFMLISSFQFYVVIYYVFGGDQLAGAEYAGYAGTVGAVATFAVVVFVTWLGTKIGKRRAFFAAITVSIVGYGLKWFCYDPNYPWLLILPAPLMAFGLGSLFTLMPSMVADVVDLDELSTYERREGMFGSIFWWVVKLGMALALAGGGYLLNATGFDVELEGAQGARTIFLMRFFDVVVPMVASGIAIWAVYRFPITEERAHEIREELERRRGPSGGPAKVDVVDGAAKELEVSDRVAKLVLSMTLEQKLGQMIQAERKWITPEQVKAHHIGSVLSGAGSAPGDNTPAAWVEMADAYWDASTSTEAGVPILYGVDAVHGHNNVLGAVVFPHNIGLGAADDPDLLERIARVTALEVLATGVEWTFAPTLAVVRNDHWGRTYESYSEDPDIVASYAGRLVRGLQGDLGTDGVVACAKHWVGDGGTTDGIDQGDTVASVAELEAIHIAPYLEALEAGVLTVMASYNSWNGEKCHGHAYLLSEVLKGRLGFTGFVVSDWNGTEQLSPDFDEAVAVAVTAGVDMFMVPERWHDTIKALAKNVEAGRVPAERIDDAVRRILSVKEAYGLFDRPRPSERRWSNDDSFGSSDHRAVAREAVQKSLVLLKNEDSVLPLKPDTRLLVAGKNADNRGHQCGGFTVEWQGSSGNDLIEGGSSVWQGIRERNPDAVLSVDGAAADSTDFDVAVVVIGEKPYAEFMGDVREGEVSTTGSSDVRDDATNTLYAATLELAKNHPEDLDTIRRITARGIPVVAVLISGRPLVITPELAESSAFVAAWLPGSEGQGVADVLFGEHDFSGKLSFSWPRSDDDNFNRGDDDYDPLFPYGHGLRYSDD